MGCKHGKYFLGQKDLEDIAETSGMDPSKIQQKFDDFVQAYPNGKISKKHFKKFMAQALPHISDKMEKLGNHIFRVYDLNNDGYIDFIEFLVVYHVMTEGSKEDVLGRIFRLFDVNGDGTISFKEMQRLVKDLYKLIVGQFFAQQTDKTTPDEIVKEVFKEMDKNEDKKISKEEFITACLAKGWFTKLVTFKVVDIFSDIYVEKKDFVADVEWNKSMFAKLGEEAEIFRHSLFC